MLKDQNTQTSFNGTGDYKLLWWRAYQTKFYTNRINQAVNDILSSDFIQQVDKIDVSLSVDLQALYRELRNASNDIKNDILVGTVPPNSDNLTDAQKKSLKEINSALDTQARTSSHGINTLKNTVNSIYSNLLGYLTTYLTALEKVNVVLNQVELKKLDN